MSTPQVQNAGQFFRKPAAPSPKPLTPTRPVGAAQGGPPSETYAAGVFRPVPRASEASEVISDLPAGFWIRAWAFLLDGFVLTVVAVPVIFVAGMLWGAAPHVEAILKGLNAAFTAFYWIFCHYKWGQTIGKMVYKIKVVTVEGLPLSMKTAVWRYVWEALSALTLGIGYLMAGWRSDKRALHDLVAKTCVIRV